ncbi:glutathione S-transferase family protein [Prochlorococcus sp. MIT 1341]|uniref:glutathione S-transferase family protein n=1 Tax=Prochlorococcus sp. MIT 1341 TaxID=3096221 RepID=UPI002A75A76E|nr:glutathione S-transferase N-terminal domain-containing protein [Prochlorococcus sp. MIT 1341]
MKSSNPSLKALPWEELERYASKEEDRVHGPTNAQSNLRLFGKKEENVRVTLYRDHHAWCPYCQKIWLWLEWKQIPYRIKKVTMRCYGKKEGWYLKKVPTGMLPAIEIDQRLITESDLILMALEKAFGPLGSPFMNRKILDLRHLERLLFQAWCQWLCTPSPGLEKEKRYQETFRTLANKMESHLAQHGGKWIDPKQNEQNLNIPGTADIIFIPYLERMNASLAYYKGLNLREQHPLIDKWLRNLEAHTVYRGTQGDMHTHAHDLPPQMGGCWIESNPNQQYFSKTIDSGSGLGEMETSWVEETSNSQNIALIRVLKHRKNLITTNPLGPTYFDQPLRAALTSMILETNVSPNKGSASALRYLRDRVSVPRDMPLLAARRFRQSLERTASLDGPDGGPSISKKDRLDQNPIPFLRGNNLIK